MDTQNTLVETQKHLETLYSKNQLLPVLREQFQTVSEDPFTVDVLTQIYLHKACPAATLVGIFSPKWGTPQEVADELINLCEQDFMDYNPENGYFSLVYEVTKDVEEMLARYQYPLPMVVKPKRIFHNKGGNSVNGYLTERGNLVLNSSSVFKDMDICLDHLNRANSIPLAINLDVVTSDQGKPDPVNRKKGEDYKDFRKRVRQAEKFYGVTVDVMESLLAFGNKFWLTHRYDRRGRTYTAGYHVNPQGTDMNKAVLELADKELIE